MLAEYGFRWIKIHRYWFGYSASNPVVISNIFDEAGDMLGQISAEEMPMGLAKAR
jgi:hypothetical protein